MGTHDYICGQWKFDKNNAIFILHWEYAGYGLIICKLSLLRSLRRMNPTIRYNLLDYQQRNTFSTSFIRIQIALLLFCFWIVRIPKYYPSECIGVYQPSVYFGYCAWMKGYDILTGRPYPEKTRFQSTSREVSMHFICAFYITCIDNNV